MATHTRTQRRTAQKEMVRGALQDAEGFVTAGQLHHRLVEGGSSVGIATVYRQLGALAESGVADTITTPKGQLFRACEPGGHHHHLVCESCGAAVEIEPPSEEWLRAIAEQHGYTITEHVFEAFGLCADCRAD